MIKWIMKEMVTPAAVSVGAAFLLILCVALPVGPMFGIAMLADAYGGGWALLFIPYFLMLNLLVTPLAFIFDCAAGGYDD